MQQSNAAALNADDSGWTPLEADAAAGAYLSVYYSSPLARWPVRDVTKVRDNKSDPNLETMSYGMFSTCEPRMRTSIVNRSIGEIFFMTNCRGAGRVLTGYYKLGWYRPGPLTGATKDYVLAASAARFVDPIPIGDVPAPAGPELAVRFRTEKMIGQAESTQLRQLIDAPPDRTERYLDEIDRLERFSRAHSGYRYPTWARTEPFSWEAADAYLPAQGDGEAVGNSSQTGWWQCLNCDVRIQNAARLKLCPKCHSVGSLRPV